MKTDRRHALQTNWLADHLGRWLEKIKPYTNHIVTGAFLLVAGVVVWLVVARWLAPDEEKTWRLVGDYSVHVEQVVARDMQEGIASVNKEIEELTRLQGAPPSTDDPARKEHDQRVQQLRDEIRAHGDALRKQELEIREREHEKLRRIAQENIGTEAGQAAALFAASYDYSQAAATLLSNPVGARNRLDQAVELLKAVRDNAQDRLQKERAKLLLARAYETRLRRDDQHQDQDDIALARREYEDLANQRPPSHCKAEAQQRLAALEPRTEGSRTPKDPVYQWVSQELDKDKPKVPFTSSGSDAFSGGTPGSR